MFSNENNENENQEFSQHEQIFGEDLDAEISLEELKKTVSHHKNNTVYGLDNVCVEVIKSSFNIISPFLLKLVNQTFDSGEYWNHGDSIY